MPAENYTVIFYAFFFLISLFFSFLINWLFLKFSFNLGQRIKNEPNQVRWAANVKPAIGGISFFIVFLISVAVIGALPRTTPTFLDNKLIGIMAASSLGFLLGLADDAYNTNPLAKFIIQLSCAFILIVSDVYIQVSPIQSVNFVITTIWVIGLMNSVNMLDNMDAITTSVSISVLLGIVGIIFFIGNPAGNNNMYMVMLIGVLGALCGFMYFNWNPSKIYMGDTGSQFLGVFLAATSILFFWGYKDNTGAVIELKQFVIPMLFFIVPLIDTITVTIRRLMRKQSPFVGGKDHITHHLAYLGLTDRQVALVLITVSAISHPLCILLISGTIEWKSLVTIAAFAYFAVVFIIFQLLYNKGKQMHALKLQAKK